MFFETIAKFDTFQFFVGYLGFSHVNKYMFQKKSIVPSFSFIKKVLKIADNVAKDLYFLTD